MLPEAVSRADGRVGHVLLGIGINVDQREFPDDLRDEATSLRLATGTAHDPASTSLGGAGRPRSTVRRVAGRRLRRACGDDWRRRASTLGERVRIGDGQEGVAVDVDETGALLVDAGRDGLTRVVSQLGSASF